MVETEKERLSRIKYRSKPEIKDKIKIKSREIYHKNMADPTKRKEISDKMKQYRKDNPEYFMRKRKEWYHKNQEFKKQYSRNRLKNIMFEVLTYYSKGNIECICCGENIIGFLTIDHINGGGNKHRRDLGMKNVAGVNFYSWLKRNDFPTGYQVMCFNCNCGRSRVRGECPHKTVLKE